MSRVRRQAGFTLLELIVVIVLIAVLSAFGIQAYLDAMDRARAVSLRMTAWRFAEATALLRAWRRIPEPMNRFEQGVDRRGVAWVDLGDSTLYLNAHGWPVTSDKQTPVTLGEQTAAGCRQVLQGLLSPPLDSATDQIDVAEGYRISVVENGRTCRYQLAQVKEENWFFDYSLESGRVRVKAPEFQD